VKTETSRIAIDSSRVIGPVNRRLFGGFVEHMGRGIYGGIYDPQHPAADDEGFRSDVIELVRELGMTVFRYPGGNFVSGFKWEDGIGPRESRPRRLNLPWHSVETNAFGLHEFVSWVEKVDGEVMLAANLGTRGILEALDLLEYANIPGGTDWSETRRQNGSDAPFNIRMWCLGNELDGPWQLGAMTADDYGKLAGRTAKAMRRIDPDLELIACGSSGSWMPTFGEWERTVLRHTYDDVKYISCHAYYQPRDGDMASYLGSGARMDTYILDLIGHADAVRDELGSDKTMQISFDEWNVWYHSRMPALLPVGIDNWPEAPAITEDDYTIADGVVVGDLLITLLNHADRVTTACMAQAVNVIAPIGAPADGPAWRKTTFYPFSLTSRHARGESLPTTIESPMISTARDCSTQGPGVPAPAATEARDVPAVHAAIVRDESGGVVIFVVNRSLDYEIDATIDLAQFGPVSQILEAVTMSGPDYMLTNSADAPDRVTPQPNTTALIEGATVRVTLPAVSWSMIRVTS
jgi:alpha-N-arabinofuranosidase